MKLERNGNFVPYTKKLELLGCSGNNIRVPNGKIEGAEISNLHVMLDLNICLCTFPQFVVKCKKNCSKLFKLVTFEALL